MRFEIWYDGNCIHEETGFDDVAEMEESAIEWWYEFLEENDEEYPSEYLVKLFDDEDSDEMTIKELLYWWFE
jgi:uncharacterized damage-inducible protein DinB